MLRHHPPRSSASTVNLRARIIITIAVFTAALLQAPGASAQSGSAQYLYVVSNGLSTYSVNSSTGAVTLVTAAPTSSAPVIAGPMVINSNASYLYTIGLNSAGQGAVFVYEIAANGAMQQTSPSPYAISQPTGTPAALVLSANGQYLYVVSSYSTTQMVPEDGDLPYTQTFIDVFTIGAGGALTLSNTVTVPAADYCMASLQTSTTPYALDIHPAQKWMYLFMSAHEPGGVLCTGEPSVMQQLILNADGTFSLGQSLQIGGYTTPASGFAASPDGTQLFTLGGLDLTPYVDALAVNPVSGQLFLSSFYSTSGSYNAGLSVDWSSTYLYNTTLGTFSIQDGNLQLLANPPPQAPSGLATSSIVPYLFGLGSGSVSVYQTNSDGSIAQVSGSPFAVAQGTQLLSGTPALADSAVLWVSPDSPISFTQVSVGQVSPYVVTLINQGYGPLDFSSIALTGDPSLSLTNTCSSPLAPGASCTATVQFKPTAAGTFTGTLTIATNVGTRTLSISAASVEPYPVPGFSIASPMLFPDTAIGSSSPLTVKLENSATQATGPLTVSSVSITGSNSGDYTQTNNCLNVSVPVGGYCTFTITFAPQASGSRVAQLTLQANLPDDPSGFGLGLTGNGATTVTKYAFNLATSGPGVVTQSPPGASLPNNTTITVTATANANSSFLNWSGGICANQGSLSPCTFVLNKDLSVTANFAANFTLTTIAVGGGTIQQSPSGTSFAPGSQILLTAVPNQGQQFEIWSPASACDGSASSTTCIVILNANTTVTGTFTGGPSYTLATSTTGPGTITQSPSGTLFPAGTSITLTAVPGSGGSFTSWSSGPCAGSTATTCNFNISANTSASATFATLPEYTLTVAIVGPGTVTVSPSGTTFPAQTLITLTAVPNAGATFAGWSGGGACNGSTSLTCSFNIDSNTTRTATFTGATNYTLTTMASGPGTITQSPSGTSFASGTAITLTAVPGTGATFTSWSGGACAGSTNATCTFNISANTTVTATFAGAPAVTVPNPSQSGGAGSAFTFALSSSGFSTTPTFTASCSIPAGSCTVSGTTLTVTTTASASRATEKAALTAWRNDDTRGSRGGGAATSKFTVRHAASASTRAQLEVTLALTTMFAAFAMWLIGAAPMQRKRATPRFRATCNVRDVRCPHATRRMRRRWWRRRPDRHACRHLHRNRYRNSRFADSKDKCDGHRPIRSNRAGWRIFSEREENGMGSTETPPCPPEFLVFLCGMF